jgi:hypothetical protein
LASSLATKNPNIHAQIDVSHTIYIFIIVYNFPPQNFMHMAKIVHQLLSQVKNHEITYFLILLEETNKDITLFLFWK